MKSARGGLQMLGHVEAPELLVARQPLLHDGLAWIDSTTAGYAADVTALDIAGQLGHEEVVLVQDAAVGLRAVIAIHDTSLGPAVGGTRMRNYPSLDDAATDALRLAR